jgi:hypothetical protein
MSQIYRKGRQTSTSVKGKLATFDFVFICMILYKEKCEINCAPETPQKKVISLGESAFMFNRVCEHVSDLQD